MLYRVVSCTVIGLLLAALAASVMPGLAYAQGHDNTGNNFEATEGQLEKMGTKAGEKAGEQVHEALTDPLGKHEEGHHGPPVNPNPLEWRKDTAIWTGIVFLVVFVLLWKFAWGPIAQGLDKRESGIANDIASAEKSNEEARALLAEYQSRLDAAEEEVKTMINKARVDAQKTGEKIVEAAKTAAEEEHQRALAEIEQATTNALGELATKSADLAVSLAGKIVRSELKASDHATLVSEAVSNFGKPK